MLTGGGLVVLGLAEDSQPPELMIQILHKGGHPSSDGTEIVVVQLLTLGGLGTE